MWKSLLGKAERPVTKPPIDRIAIEFNRSVHRFMHDPAGPLLPARQCFDCFGSDLLRYVPAPMIGLWPTVRVDEGGSKIHSFLDGKGWDQSRYPMAEFPQFKLANDAAREGESRESDPSCRRSAR